MTDDGNPSVERETVEWGKRSPFAERERKLLLAVNFSSVRTNQKPTNQYIHMIVLHPVLANAEMHFGAEFPCWVLISCIQHMQEILILSDSTAALRNSVKGMC